jgi:nitrile hydratase beta subunit
MNGIHDLGGMQDMGPITPELNEPVFHERWERTVFGLTFATFGAHYNGDEFRWGIEKMGPAHYLESPYYAHWLYAVEHLLVERGVLTEAEIAERMSELAKGTPLNLAQRPPDARSLPVQAVDGVIATGGSARMDADVAPRFRPGDRIRAQNINPPTHTRLPRYVRGKTGIVEADRGVFSFNDTNSRGLGHKPQHVYSVEFSARELWGEQAAAKDALYLELFEDYIIEAHGV